MTPLSNNTPQPVLPPRLNLFTPEWEIPGWSGATMGISPVLVNGWVNYQPIFVDEEALYDRIAVEVVGAIAATLDIRVFAFDSGGVGALILDAGNVDMTAPGWKQITIALTLARNAYWLAHRTAAGGGGTLRVLNYAHLSKGPLAGVSGSGASAPASQCGRVNAAWSDPGPAITGVDSAQRSGIWLRRS
jgi:hypothetical protein